MGSQVERGDGVITELRRYRIKPGRMDSWLAVFEGALTKNLEHGMRVEYAGIDRETNSVLWLRSFADEADRVARKSAFYGSDWWLEREAQIMDHVLEYEVTFLEAWRVHDGSVTAAPPDTGDRPGSNLDGPPDGWSRSTRATFAPFARSGEPG